MTLYEFLSLNEDDQANAMWAGDFLYNRIEGAYAYNLYDLGGLYVEVCYQIEENRIERFRPFKKSTPLEPYLAQFNLSDLM